jgi:hypothetical protein
LSFNGLLWTNVSKSTFLNGYATESWVNQNYLALAGGTMANTNKVANMNADLLDGFHSFGETTPGLLYKYYQKFENSSTPSDD